MAKGTAPLASGTTILNPKNLLIAIFLLSTLALLCAACETTGVVKVDDSEVGGCSGLLPAAALRERNVNVEVANSTIQQVAAGKFQVSYEDTLKRLLTDEILQEWVRQELICQGAKTFEAPEQRLWYMTMKEVAARESQTDLLAWLRENPLDSFRAKLEQQTIEIETINGEIILPDDAIIAKVGKIRLNGVLVVPGVSSVTVEQCNGRIKHNPKARIIVRSSGLNCRQTYLTD